MSLVVIPTTPSVAAFTQRTTLDGKDYVLFFRFNRRLGRWSMDINDQDGRVIAAGVMLVTNYPLARLCLDPRKPQGPLFVLDGLSLNDSDPSFCTLGARFQLVYGQAAA